MAEIVFYNRYSDKLEIEKVYGAKAVSFFYENLLGKRLSNLIAFPFVSTLYGFTQDRSLSSRKVAPFIKNFNIPIDDYEKGSFHNKDATKSYRSFNEFFVRKFKKDKRVFSEGEKLPAFAEARYLGFNQVDDNVHFPVKGKFLSSAKLLLGMSQYYEDFLGGPLLIARLCPVDYHRYHYPDDGETLDSFKLGGLLHSVNPLALKFRPTLFTENVRRVSVLETKNFGKLAYIEVGATCVGKIVQTFDEQRAFKRGDEKGYFLFGGSTVIVLGQKNKWRVSEDIEKNSAKGIEVYSKLGDCIGYAQ